MMLHQLHSPGGIRFFRGQCGWTRLRADVEVVWTAIQQSPDALAFADAKLRRNKPLVLQAPFDGRKMGWLLSGLVIIFNICNHLQCGAFLNGHLNLFKQAFCEDIVRSLMVSISPTMSYGFLRTSGFAKIYMVISMGKRMICWNWGSWG